MIFIYLISGFVSGILGGMGLGGGTLLIPVLTYFMHFKQIAAQQISLVCFLPMSSVTLIFHIKNKFVRNIKDILIISISGIVTTIAGAILAEKTKNESLRKYFAIFLIVIGIIQFISTFIQKETDDK